MNLLKLKKYKGLVSDEEHGHTVHAINQITSKGLDMSTPDKSLSQTDGYRQMCIPSTNSYSKQAPKSATENTNVWRPISTAPTTLCSLLHMWCIWAFEKKMSAVSFCTAKCVKLFKGHNTSSHNTISKQTKYPTIGISPCYVPNSSQRLTQQLTTDYTLNPHVCNETADKINKMIEENRLIKQTVLGTYERMKGKC